MWRRSAVVFLLLVPAAVLGQSVDLPPGPMREKARAACMQCHDARIIVQQRLEPRVWAKVVDKMVRWGAPVTPEERQAYIEYFSANFGPERPMEQPRPGKKQHLKTQRHGGEARRNPKRG